MATIRNVADKAGVSIGTVSRVLNNKEGVGEKTRQHVFDVARELGYRIPPRAKSTGTEIIHFGLLSRHFEGGVIANPFYHDVIVGVDRACQENDINLSFSTLSIATPPFQSSLPLLKHEQLSGLILVGFIPGDVIFALLAQTSLPVVLIDNCLPEYELDAVMIDNSRGIKLAVEHLIAQGHCQISFLSGPNHPSVVERHQAYLSTIRAHHLTPHVVTCPGLDVSDGAAGATEVICQRPQTTAIVCANDMQAIGAIRKLQELGYEVPADISVVGFDDIDLAQITSPAITTIQVDRVALGQVATRMLLTRISNPERPVLTTKVGVRLVERQSTAPRRSRPPGNGTFRDIDDG